MATEQPEERWGEIGKTYNPKEPGTPNVKQPIKIMEMARSVSMDDETDPQTHRKEPYGQPIDLPLAVYLMRNLFDQLGDYNVLPFLKKYDILLQAREMENSGASAGDTTTEPGDKEIPDKEIPDLEGEELSKLDCKAMLRMLIQLLVHSRAITIDKNILLKCLSQPKCEGLRFYLCLTPHRKPRPKSTPDSPYSHLENGDLSLVTVGVDCDGNDLNYKMPIGEKDNIEDLITVSLVGEYAHPPGTGFATTPVGSKENVYRLWDYAFAPYRDVQPASSGAPPQTNNQS